MDFEGAKKLIDEAKTICLIGHKKPDGDAIGSVLAMYLALEQLGIKDETLNKILPSLILTPLVLILLLVFLKL